MPARESVLLVFLPGLGVRSGGFWLGAEQGMPPGIRGAQTGMRDSESPGTIPARASVPAAISMTAWARQAIAMRRGTSVCRTATTRPARSMKASIRRTQARHLTSTWPRFLTSAWPAIQRTSPCFVAEGWLSVFVDVLHPCAVVFAAADASRVQR